MTVIKLNPEALPLLSNPLPLGIRGENEVTQVIFDVAAWIEAYGDGVVQLQVRRPGDSAAYPVTLTRSGNDAIWTLSSTDLAVRGECKAEYIYTVGTAIKKSCVLYYYVQTDIGDGGPAPDPYEDWLAKLEELAAETEQSAQDAEAASEAIQDMSVAATALQPGSSPTVTKAVDPETGAVTLTFGLAPGPQGQQGADGADGVSPSVTITEITGGHSVTITDAAHPGGQSFDVLDGEDGAQGPEGPAGPGVPAGGTTGQVLKKKSGTDYDTEWADESTEVYWATYDTTDALTIIGKISSCVVLCKYNNRIYVAVAYTTAGVSQVRGTVTFKSVSTSASYELYVDTYASYQSNPPIVQTTWTNSSTELAPLNSPALTGTPTAPTAASGTNTTQLATTAFVEGEIADKADSDLGVSGASAGQYVKIKTVDGSGKPTSFEPGTPSGGGGTTDYTELTNKPQINGHTLSGNQSAADLGLGTYSKPSGGIPDSDLSSAVQTSLSKADTALQSVPDTYRTAAAQDVIDGGKLGTSGDGSNVTAAFTAASSRANIATGEKLSVLFGKIAKWFSDLGTAAFRAATGRVTQSSTDLIESGAVFSGLAEKQAKITASGILKGDGSGGVSAATAGTDYQTPLTAGTDYATPSQIPSVPSAYTSNPAALGTANPGSSTSWAKGDHVHPKPSASDIGAAASDLGVSGASVGQYVKIKTVDGSGKPTSFEPGTPSGGGGGASIDLGLTGASVGDLIRVSAVDANGAPTAWTKAPLCEVQTNPNLLDNWYFAGGGSQQNGGQFPINQRGQTSYSTASAYTIDRWKLTSGSVSLVSGGLTLNGTLVQIREQPVGQTVTASALLSDGTMLTPSYDDTTKTFTLTATGQTIVAVKLELGSEQTLAHLVSGSRMLNELPDYQAQLLICMRYLQKFQRNFRMRSINRTTSNGTTIIDFMWTLVVPMRKNAVLSGSPSWHLNAYGGGSNVPSEYTIGLQQQLDNALQIRAVKNSTDGLTDAQLFAEYAIWISAEL